MDQPIPVQEKSFQIFPVVLSVLLTAVIVGGGMYYWQTRIEMSHREEVKLLSDRVDQLEEDLALRNESEVSYVELEDQLFEARVRLSYAGGGNSLIRNPLNPTQFLYINSDSIRHYIRSYNALDDAHYQEYGYASFPGTNQILFSQELEEYYEFRGVGFDGNKFVFVETTVDNSPGPCVTRWQYGNLEFIDLTSPNPERMPYTLTEEKRASIQKEAQECRDRL